MGVVETQEAIAAASAAFPKWSALSAKVDSNSVDAVPLN